MDDPHRDNILPFRTPEALDLYSRMRDSRIVHQRKRRDETPGLVLILILVLFASNVGLWVAILALADKP